MEDKYIKQHGKRFTSSQKKRFLEELEKDFTNLGYETSQFEGKKFLSKAVNQVFGNLKSAKTILLIPYDTPERKFASLTKYYPFHGTKSMNKDFWYTFVPMIVIYVLVLIVYINAGRLSTNPMILRITFTFIIASLAMICYMFVHGIANRHNANRNTSGILCALKIASELSKEEKRSVAFVFTDKNRKRPLGSEILKQKLDELKKSPNIIALECVGTGEDFAVGYLAGSKKLAQELTQKNKTKYTNVLMKNEQLLQTCIEPFTKAVKISCGEFDSKHELCVYGTGTGKDRTIQEENIEIVKETVCKYLKNR